MNPDYAAEWSIVDASDHGMPHRQRAVYSVGRRLGPRSSDMSWPSPIKARGLDPFLDKIVGNPAEGEAAHGDDDYRTKRNAYSHGMRNGGHCSYPR